MAFLSNVTLFNNQTLDVELRQEKISIENKNLDKNFTWNPISFNSKTLTLKVDFENSWDISKGVRLQLLSNFILD